MSEHFLPQWHVYWNLSESLPGSYQYGISFNDETKESFSITLVEEDFQITLPVLTYPLENTVVNTTTPIFKYQQSASTDRAYIRIEEKVGAEWESKDWILVDNPSEYTIDDNILENGKEYRWTLQTVCKAKAIPWTEAKAAYQNFSVTIED